MNGIMVIVLVRQPLPPHETFSSFSLDHLSSRGYFFTQLPMKVRGSDIFGSHIPISQCPKSRLSAPFNPPLTPSSLLLMAKGWNFKDILNQPFPLCSNFISHQTPTLLWFNFISKQALITTHTVVSTQPPNLSLPPFTHLAYHCLINLPNYLFHPIMHLL